MFETTITITRKNVTIDQGVPVKVDAVSPQVVADNGGRSPYDSYTLYSLEGTPDLQRGDLIADQNTTLEYRVFGGIKRYGNDYLKCLIERVLTV